MALYFLIYVLVKKILQDKRYLLFVIGFFCYIACFMLLNRIEDYYLIYPLTKSDTLKHTLGFWNIKAAFLNLIYLYPVVGLGAAIYFAKSWYDTQLSQERLLREKSQAEIKFLKDQLHPHFLFNTLNNIYSLSQVNHASTPDMMLRLSKLLSFMLYDCNEPKILLTKEIKALRDYVELERLRLGERLEINFQASGNIAGKEIHPLLLFPLLENCFKHGSHKTTDKIWISFNLVANENEVIAQIENTLPRKEKETTAGIGLDNLKKRLMYAYAGKHELTIRETENYLVYLKILLT